jgi:hypothetical protein
LFSAADDAVGDRDDYREDDSRHRMTVVRAT